MRKKVFHLDHERSVEVDAYCQAEDPAHADLAIEVKDRATPVLRDNLSSGQLDTCGWGIRSSC